MKTISHINSSWVHIEEFLCLIKSKIYCYNNNHEYTLWNRLKITNFMELTINIIKTFNLITNFYLISSRKYSISYKIFGWQAYGIKTHHHDVTDASSSYGVYTALHVAMCLPSRGWVTQYIQSGLVESPIQQANGL